MDNPGDHTNGSGQSTDAAAVTRMITTVNHLTATGPDRHLIDLISHLEPLKAACAAMQIRATYTFTEQQTLAAILQHTPADITRRSIVGQIALAQHTSPVTARKLVAHAETLLTDLPHTLAALAAGHTNEHHIHTAVEQLTCLTTTDRQEADRQLAPQLPGLGHRGTQEAAARLAARLDPTAVMKKTAPPSTTGTSPSKPPPTR